MFITNPDVINEKKFYCKSKNLKKFLCEIKNIKYISRQIDENDKKTIWIFLKTDELSKALLEWKHNKEIGKLAFPKE
jgi:hypothetical protein